MRRRDTDSSWNQTNMSKNFHLAIIPDGCRRWALAKGLSLAAGYIEAVRHLQRISMEWCFGNLPVTHLTFFIISTENLQKRPPDTLDPGLRAVEWLLKQLIRDERLRQKKVRVQFIGCTDLLPSKTNDLIKELETTTSTNNNYFLTVCAPYGGKQEIVNATKRIASLVHSQKIAIDDITEELFEKHLDTACLPDVDILIRTAEKRISNFALWKLAYSEIYFFDKFFPDLTKKDLDDVLRSFSKTERRYGGTSDRVDSIQTHSETA